MTSNLADYIQAGYGLTPDERLAAAHQLLLSVDQDEDADPNEIDAAWDNEVARRVEEIVNGKAQLVNGRESMAQIRAELAARRK